MCQYLLDNEPFSPSRSGFKPRDSSINQLIGIIHELRKGFNDGLEVWGVVLNICKAFVALGSYL